MKKNKIRIAVIVEVKKRELPFFSILENILILEGYDVKLIPFHSLCAWRLLKFRPDIIVVNGIRTTEHNYYSQIALPKQLAKSKVVCYYSEQIGYYDGSLAKGYKNELVFDNVDYHVAWGPRFCRDLEKEGVDHDKLWYIGSLQYDIDCFSKKNGETIKADLAEQYGIDKNKRWILYADNIIKEYQPSEFYLQRRRDSFNVVKKTAEKNPDAIIIFRPHPNTSNNEMKSIKEFFANNENVIFNNEGHIYYWTASCNATIVWCSTSSLQAMFMNKPVFGFMTSDKQNLERYWYRGVLPLYENFDQLAEDIYNCFNGGVTEQEKLTREARAEYIKEWYFKKNGLAFNRFVSLIEEVSKSEFRHLRGIGCKVTIMKLCHILAYELKQYIIDFVNGKYKDNIISKTEKDAEKERHDMNIYKHQKFSVKSSESGKYFE